LFSSLSTSPNAIAFCKTFPLLPLHENIILFDNDICLDDLIDLRAGGWSSGLPGVDSKQD
jgi:hypothetical protein